MAIERGVRVVPVLVGGAAMPTVDQLPGAGGSDPIERVGNQRAPVEQGMSYLADHIAKWKVLPEPVVASAGREPDDATAVRAVQKKVCLVGAPGVGKTSLVRRLSVRYSTNRT